MKKLTISLIATLILIMSSCSSSDNGAVGNQAFLLGFRSQLCTNVSGATAAYWDLSHSLPVPLPEVPLVQNPGQQFIHSQLPYIGFVMPQGFTGFEITDPATATLGVNVFRNDNNVLWRYVPTSQTPGVVDVNNVIANEINALFNFYGFNGTPNVMCSTPPTDASFGGIQRVFTARLLQFGNMTAQIYVITTYAAGSTFASISVSAAPTAEFDAQIVNTFLPISWQLLVGPERIQDSDGDGNPDVTDPDPTNPNVR